jgi:hypothetical protein
MKQFQDVNRVLRSKRTQLSSRSRQPVPRYRVGEPFIVGHEQWREGTQLTYDPLRCELTLFQREIRESTVAEVRRGASMFP